MRRVTAAEITKIITNSPAKHCSLDPAPTWLVKRALPLLADTIALMCNTSITEGVFPDALKHAIVRPRLKKSTLDPTQLSSYRPISNLSFVSKTVERVIAACFSEHVEENNLLPSRQSAYRPYHSTETAVMAVHDEIVRKIDNGQVCALVLLDLSAAFDTVDHDTLRQVLSRRFGVQGSMMAWFDSYLINRTQTFQFGTNQSGPHRVDCSVPQGSVLGPQEFTAYTEDLACLIHRHHLGHHLYADDTQLIDSVKIVDIGTLINRLQLCIDDITSWCASRRLQLNPVKTELIWFGTTSSLKKIMDVSPVLNVGNDVIRPVSVVRDLGVLLDQELSMKQHINKITSSCFFQLRRLKQVRRILGPEITASLVSAFVTSRLDYCNALLAGLPKSTIAPLQRVQNAAARLITGIRYHDHVTPALQSLHWLPVSFRITYKLCVLMHLVHIGCSPAYLSELVTATSELPSRRSLRSANTQQYEVPLTKLKFGERSFSFAGPVAWNSLTPALHNLSNTHTFKKQLKTYLFNKAYS